MKLSGAAVVEALSGEDTIRDAIIRGVQIGDESDQTYIRISLEARRGSKYKAIELTLRGVIKYGFFGSGEWCAHVEFLKLGMTGDDEVYVSFDPFDERTELMADEDNDFVHARSIEAILTPR